MKEKNNKIIEIKDVINFDYSIDYCIIVRKQYLQEKFENNKKELSILIEKAIRRIKNEI